MRKNYFLGLKKFLIYFKIYKYCDFVLSLPIPMFGFLFVCFGF